MRFKLFLLLFFGIICTFAQEPTLSDKAEISIITVEPGKSLNDTWGHSAIRIKDNTLGFDVVYNYGIYDFNTPNFYTKFMQGKLLYNLGVNKFHRFVRHYKSVNRGVIEQVLDLTQAQKQAYFEYLQNNAKPENKKYLYEFFFDNCATKLRYVNTKILKDEVIYNDNLFTDDYTFRDLIYQKLDKHPWGKFGIDIALGSVIDRKATSKEFTFLPSYVFENFKNAKVRVNGVSKPLIKQTNVIYKQEKQSSKTLLLTPMILFSILALIIIGFTYLDYKKKKQTKWIDFALLFITGLVGLLVVLLWFATDHSATKDNYNLFWGFLPNLVVAFYVFKLTKQAFFKKYYLLLLILLVVGIVLWILKIQIFNLALIPVIIMLGVRYFYNYKAVKIISEV